MINVEAIAPPVNPTRSLVPSRTTIVVRLPARSGAQAMAPHMRARMLTTLPWLADRGQAVSRLLLISAGFVPVTLIAASTFGVFGLHDLAVAVLAPAVATVVVLAIRHPAVAKLIGRALVAGIFATALYDLLRFGFIGLHLVGPDPIPHIGAALRLHPEWTFGYLWRYVGNGGGLAIAFYGLGFRGVRQGMTFGLFVCSGLLVTLVISPHAQEFLFPLTVTSVIELALGHLVYGFVMGAISTRGGRSTQPASPVDPVQVEETRRVPVAA